MADINNTTKSKILFMSNSIVLDYFQDWIIVCDKHRGFYNLHSPRLVYIDVSFIFKWWLKVSNQETVTPHVILCLSTVTPLWGNSNSTLLRSTLALFRPKWHIIYVKIDRCSIRDKGKYH